MIEPTNERETIALFKTMQVQLGWYIVHLQVRCPDAIIENQNGERLRAEFEYDAKNFMRHGHRPGDCDLVIAWENSWAFPTVPVLELCNVVQNLTPPVLLVSAQKKEQVIIKTFSLTPDIVDWLAEQKNASETARAAITEYRDRKEPPPEPDMIILLRRVLVEIQELKDRGVTIAPEVNHIVEQVNGEAESILLDVFGK
jgi:hypothetical protein